ncbi:TrmH family RNA methyltransferase, partial [Streptomyces hainanensis]
MSDEIAGRWRRLADETVLLDGFHALKHALRFGADVRSAVAADRGAALGLARELAPDLVETVDALLVEVGPEGLATLVSRPHPTGVAALATPAPREPAPGAPVVVLDQPRHLGNVGAVIRLAAGMDAGGVLTVGTVDPWHPNVLRAAAGLHYATAVTRRDSAASLPGDRPLYALDPAGVDIRRLRIPDDAMLAFGSERGGLSAEVRGRAEVLVSLPMRAGVSSYNLAT